MQSLTAPPRDQLTAAQVEAVLTLGAVEVDFGVDLLDASLNLVDDLSPDVSACTVSRDMTATVHGTVQMTLTRELAWGLDRVRPWMILTDPNTGVSARFNLGVYVLTTPDSKPNETPASFDVSGFDQLHLLQSYVGDSWHVDNATAVLDAVQAALSAAGVTAPVLLDSTAAGVTLPSGKTWPLLPGQTTATGKTPANQATGSGPFMWADVVNQLLAAIGYEPVWCDWDGNFRAGPYLLPEQRPVEWTFPVGDLVEGIVEADRTISADVWGVPNRWVFYINGTTGQPVEGTTQYTVINQNRGPASQQSLNRLVTAQPQGLDAANYASLVTQGDAIVSAALRVSETVTVNLSPFPLAWHNDRATYVDDAVGAPLPLIGQSWSLPCDGSAMNYVWAVIT